MWAAARQADGAILVGGQTSLVGQTALSVVRFTAKGELDRNFGSGGRATFESGDTTFLVQALATDPLGRILVAGRITENARTSVVVYRLWP
jgi:Domain of unknown function (DUF5122) beta-propeller